jgi:hypothetical protein
MMVIEMREDNQKGKREREGKNEGLTTGSG